MRELVLEGGDETGDEVTGAALDQARARVRKRFQLVTDTLKQMAEDEGLLCVCGDPWIPRRPV